MDISRTRPARRMTFGEHLVKARNNLKLSQEALAEAIGTTSRSISRWERNQTFPQQYYLDRLCAALRITPEIIIEANPEAYQETPEEPLFLWHVPCPRNPYFTGREELLRQIHAQFEASLPLPLILAGLGGIGKTQTILEYLYVFQHEYKAIFWVHAETHEALSRDYHILGQLFRLSERELADPLLLREGIKRWFHYHDNWLLVFDNAENLEVLQSMLPDASRGHIVITTRLQAIGTIGILLDHPKMNKQEGVLFLLRRAKIVPLTARPDTLPPALEALAADLVDQLDGLPLALDQAGAYIEETRMTVAEYLECYYSNRQTLLGYRGSISTYHPASVNTTFARILNHLASISPVGAELLSMCAFLHTEAIPEELFTQINGAHPPIEDVLTLDALSFHGALRDLQRFSLIQRTPENCSFSVHKLLQMSILDALEPKRRNSSINSMARILTVLLARKVTQIPSLDNYKGCCHPQRYLPHVLSFMVNIKKWNIRSAEVDTFLAQVGQWQAGRSNCKERKGE